MTDEQWWIHRKEFPNGRTGFVVPLSYGRGRVTIGYGELTYDRAW
jgi:hypothetical protein